MKTSNRFVGVLAVIFFAMPLPALAQQPIIIKFSHVVAVDTAKGKAVDFFARRAGELTEGKVKVEVYPDSTLYKDKEELDALQLGVVQMLAVALSKYRRLGVKEFEAFDLPYIFNSVEEVHKVTQGPLGASLLAKLEAKGIKGLAFWDNGFKSFSANRPLRTPADFKGLKMRIQASNVLESQMRSLGALPEAMAFSDVYQALKTGIVDGTENPHSNLYTQRMYEVQKYMTLSDHGYLGYVVITNKKFWESLPAGIRGQLAQAIKEATAYENRIAQEENNNALEKLRATGKIQIHTPTAAERAELRKAMLKTHGEMAPRIGQETIDAIYRETGFNPARLDEQLR